MATLSDDCSRISYKLESISEIAECLGVIEGVALNDDSVPGEPARIIIQQINLIRSELMLAGGVRRHKKFAPELQGDGNE